MPLRARPKDPSVSIEIRELGADDTSAFLALFRISFGKARSPEEFEWRYRSTPFGGSIFGAFCEERLVGALALDVIPGSIDGRDVRVARCTDLMVAPAHRGTKVSRLLVERVQAEIRSHAIALHFPAERTYAASVGSELRRAGRLTQWIRWEGPVSLRRDAPYLPGLAAHAVTSASTALANASAVRVRSQHHVEISVGELDDRRSDFDRLADEMSNAVPATLRRGHSWLRWRWLDRPEPCRLVVNQTVDEKLRGFVVFREEGANCVIGDIVSLEASVLRGLLGAVRTRTSPSIRRTVIELNDPRRWAARTLRSSGYLARGRGPEISLKALSGNPGRSLVDAQAWYLTAGDADLM